MKLLFGLWLRLSYEAHYHYLFGISLRSWLWAVVLFPLGAAAIGRISWSPAVAISALALLQKRWRVYLDASAQDCGEILVSAGQRGINLQLAVDDLIKVTGAPLSKTTRPPAEAPE